METIYGLNPVLEVLRSRRRACHQILIASGRKDSDALRVSELAAKCGVPVKVVSKLELSNIVAIEKAQGIVAKCDPYPFATLEEALNEALKDEQKGFFLILDGITDPQNLGALVRTANLMGVHGIILPKDNSASITPAVVKASAGATEYQKIVQVTNISNTIGYIKEKGFWVSGAEGESTKMLYNHDFKGQHVAIVLGAEDKGIRRLVREKCDFLLSIPMTGSIDSYNVSVAGALFMGEVARQRWLSLHAKIVPKTPQTP